MADPAGVCCAVSFNLSVEDVDCLRELARSQSISVTAALRRAIATEQYLRDLIDTGATILLEKPGKPLQRLVLRVDTHV